MTTLMKLRSNERMLKNTLNELVDLRDPGKPVAPHFLRAFSTKQPHEVRAMMIKAKEADAQSFKEIVAMYLEQMKAERA